MTIINIYDAKTHFSRLIERVVAGEEVTIARAGKPVARLVPIPTETPARVPGRLRHLGCPPDSFFFDPLPEEELRLWEGGRTLDVNSEDVGPD